MDLYQLTLSKNHSELVIKLLCSSQPPSKNQKMETPKHLIIVSKSLKNSKCPLKNSFYLSQNTSTEQSLVSFGEKTNKKPSFPVKLSYRTSRTYQAQNSTGMEGAICCICFDFSPSDTYKKFSTIRPCSLAFLT
jgi:hypothetical protein